MPGVRVHHPTHRSITFVVEIASRPTAPFDCPRCKETHRAKTYHVDLDSEGDAIVSEGVLEGLNGVGLAGLLILNEVPDPPEIRVGMGEPPVKRRAKLPIRAEV